MKFDNRFFIIIIVAIITYATFLIFSDFTKITDSVENFQIEYLPIILILLPTGWLFLYLRWQFLLKNIGATFSHKMNFQIFLSGFALGVTPGKVGELLKSQLLKNNFNIPRKTTAPIILIERFYNAVGLLIISCFGILVFDFSALVLFITGILLSFIFFILRSKLLFSKFIKQISRVKFLSKYSVSLEDSYDIIEKSTKFKVFFVSSMLSGIYWIIESIAVYFILLALGINIIDFLTIIPIYATSMILGVASFIPGGLIVTEGTLAGLLNLHGLELTLALSVVIIIRIFTLWYPVIVGFFALKFSGAFKINHEKIND
ncbi:MAG: hypothetical protein CL763_10300 [Chloroflexi bacterium]|nr:hypothetical protein [Chloroflexota bacterium]|tara:strand:+ start:4736 stop:5686 length:951 start_codon:yes stop_codon:yes gene_type:complete